MADALFRLLNQPLVQAGSGLSIEQITRLTEQIEELRELIQDEHTLPRNMRHWEFEFIQSISIQFEELRNISPEQRRKIEELHSKFC